MITPIVLLMDAAILNNTDAFLVDDHVVESPAKIEPTSSHEMRPISKLLLQWVEVAVGVYESQIQ